MDRVEDAHAAMDAARAASASNNPSFKLLMAKAENSYEQYVADQEKVFEALQFTASDLPDIEWYATYFKARANALSCKERLRAKLIQQRFETERMRLDYRRSAGG